MTAADDGPPPVTPFAAVLQQIDRGNLHAELTDELAKVVRAVLAAGTDKPKGTLTLTLTVQSMPRAANGLMVSGRVSTKEPATLPPTSVFFGTDSGGLSRTDPRQAELPGLQLVTNNSAREAS